MASKEKSEELQNDLTDFKKVEMSHLSNKDRFFNAIASVALIHTLIQSD